MQPSLWRRQTLPPIQLMQYWNCVVLATTHCTYRTVQIVSRVLFDLRCCPSGKVTPIMWVQAIIFAFITHHKYSALLTAFSCRSIPHMYTGQGCAEGGPHAMLRPCSLCSMEHIRPRHRWLKLRRLVAGICAGTRYVRVCGMVLLTRLEVTLLGDLVRRWTWRCCQRRVGRRCDRPVGNMASHVRQFFLVPLILISNMATKSSIGKERLHAAC